MPIYEYGCRKCGREFEELVFGDATPNCPECGSDDVEKMMSRCCHRGGGSDGGDYSDYSAGASAGCGGGCSGCAGGHCATCGH